MEESESEQLAMEESESEQLAVEESEDQVGISSDAKAHQDVSNREKDSLASSPPYSSDDSEVEMVVPLEEEFDQYDARRRYTDEENERFKRDTNWSADSKVTPEMIRQMQESGYLQRNFYEILCRPGSLLSMVNANVNVVDCHARAEPPVHKERVLNPAPPPSLRMYDKPPRRRFKTTLPRSHFEEDNIGIPRCRNLRSSSAGASMVPKDARLRRDDERSGRESLEAEEEEGQEEHEEEEEDDSEKVKEEDALKEAAEQDGEASDDGDDEKEEDEWVKVEEVSTETGEQAGGTETLVGQQGTVEGGQTLKPKEEVAKDEEPEVMKNEQEDEEEMDVKTACSSAAGTANEDRRENGEDKKKAASANEPDEANTTKASAAVPVESRSTPSDDEEFVDVEEEEPSFQDVAEESQTGSPQKPCE